MNFILKFLKETKVGKFIDNKINGDKKREEKRKVKHHKKDHHHFSDNHDDDDCAY
jgi:hypothetical protein